MQLKKQINTSITEDEAEYEEAEIGSEYKPLDFTKHDREEGHIYESVEDEIGDLVEVLRDLPDLGTDDTEEVWAVGLLDDALGG